MNHKTREILEAHAMIIPTYHVLLANADAAVPTKNWAPLDCFVKAIHLTIIVT